MQDAYPVNKTTSFVTKFKVTCIFKLVSYNDHNRLNALNKSK